MNQTSVYNMSWKGITLTKAAIKHITQLVNKEPEILGLKITIKKSGCAGFVYKLNTVFSIEKKSVIYENTRFKLFIPFDVIPLIDGTELDYVQDGLNYSFKFNNPKAQYSCGCGKSFGI